MLTQTYRRQVPGTTAFVERTLLRDRHFCVALVRARMLAVDMGVLTHAVRHLERLARPQLTITLAGRAYFALAGRTIVLGPGDLVVTDPSRHDGEGYGGGDAEVITIESDAGGIFALPRFEGVVARIGRADVAVLRALVASYAARRPDEWIASLARVLGAIGLPLAHRLAVDLEPTPGRLVSLYGAIGPALSRLDQQPSLGEIAGTIGTSERQANRLLGELTRDYQHPFASWRELVHEMRLMWATQLLSMPDLSLERVASLAGYRSSIALHHALSIRGAATPRAIARDLAERWG